MDWRLSYPKNKPHDMAAGRNVEGAMNGAWHPSMGSLREEAADGLSGIKRQRFSSDGFGLG